MFGRLGMAELVVLLVVVLIIFGPSRLPELASSIGKSFKAFKDGVKDSQEEKKDGEQKS